MLLFLSFLVKIIFNLAGSRRSLLIKIALLEKELEILQRKNQKRRLIPKQSDRIIFVIMNFLFNIKNSISIYKPETILKWQRIIIKGLWTYRNEKKKPGRPPVSTDIKKLILHIKNDNIYIGYRKIVGELLKLGIKLDHMTVRKILEDFRRKGKIRKSLLWKKFLKIHMNSIYAMDFFTVDTMMSQRYYVYFIIHHKTRQIMQFAITKNPLKEFVRQQIIKFSEATDDISYMIRDRAPQFNLDYLSYGIKEVSTSVRAPNMRSALRVNSIAERWIGSVRREALDYFIIFGEKQLKRILWHYISYYNSQRPHQGIEQRSPIGYIPQKVGKVQSKPILGGLIHHYYREAA